jgi:ribosome-binding ATPase YchF (GTP1/OBG family)
VRFYSAIVLLVAFCFNSSAQEKVLIANFSIIDGDTFFIADIPEVEVLSFKNKESLAFALLMSKPIKNKPNKIVIFFDKEKILIDTMQLITNKPVLYICNVDESSAVGGNSHVDQIKMVIEEENSEFIILAVAIEADINELDTYEDRQVFLSDIGLSEPGSSKMIRKAYDLLNLQTYFTAGVKEVRAWTILKGMSAPQAAGVIHTDFEKGFIKAEVISYSNYIKFGSESKAREVGKLKIEGKDYIVNDGDIMHFRFNI